MNKFKLHIGDWSDDGHGKTRTVFFESNRTVEELREIFFVNKEVYGDFLETYCADYQDGYISEDDIEEMEEIGIKISDDLKEEAENGQKAYVSPEDIIDWFIQFMKLGNPSLILTEVSEAVPMFHFYGYDEKQRHIGQFGYGLFE